MDGMLALDLSGSFDECFAGGIDLCGSLFNIFLDNPTTRAAAGNPFQRYAKFAGNSFGQR